MEIHIARNGKQSGPFPVEEVRRQLATGQLFYTDLGWVAGATDWMPLSTFPALAATQEPQREPTVSPLRALNPTRPAASVVAPPRAQSTSGAAVASLILGILAITILPILSSIGGIACGHVARSNIRDSHGSLTGDGMAIAGLVMSYLGLAFWGLMLLLLPVLAGIAVPVFAEVKLRGEETKMLSNGRQIVRACKLYATDHGSAFPKKLDDLYPEYLVTRTVFTSSLSPGEPMAYDYFGGSSQDPADKLLLISKFKDRHGKRIMIFVDGSGRVGPPPPGY